MKGLAQTNLRSFDEQLLGTEISIFGNVAVAIAGCAITEDESDVSRSAEALLLIKDDGTWRVAAQACDGETGTRKLPPGLANGRGRAGSTQRM